MRHMPNSLSRVPQVFDLLSANPRGLSVTELAEKMRTSKSTSSRLLSSLLEAGLIERDDAQRYFLDVRFWTWGVQAARRLAVLDIARPHIADAVEKLAVPASIAVVRGDQTIYLETMTPAKNGQTFAMFNIVSYATPVYACAPGKAILAFSGDEVIQAILAGPLQKFTPATLATPEELEHELETIRLQGYAVNRGEYYDNSLIAVAAPILDQGSLPVAAVCFYGFRDEAAAKEMVGPLLRLADVISLSLGYSKSMWELVG
jgi:DNA-binding IclR family transcriptional regulator